MASRIGSAQARVAAKLLLTLRARREELKGYVEAARATYVTAAAGITSTWRDLVRVHGRFATIYASGCVGIRFEVLPFTPEVLLAAILVCERAHVAFIDQEVRRHWALVLPAPDAQKAVAAIVAPAKTPLARMNKYMEDNIPDGLIDLRNPATVLPEDHDHATAPGYVIIHDKKIELCFSNDRFEKIAGGKREGQVLKKKLATVGSLMVWGRGKGAAGSVVKRRIAGLGLKWVVAFRPPKALRARLPKLNKA